MDRDGFIAAIVTELRRQKVMKGGEAESFFTGLDPTAVDVFRKLCYDFPIINNDMLEVFLGALQRWEESSVEFREIFAFNERMAYNLTSLHGSQTEGSSEASSKRQQELVCCISAELYLSFASRIVDWPLSKVSKLFERQGFEVDTHKDLLEAFKRHFTTFTASQVSGSISVQYLAEGRHLMKLLKLIESLLVIYTTLSSSSIKPSVQSIDSSSKLLDLVQFLHTELIADELEAELSYRIEWLKDIIVHTCNTCIEIVSTLPELLVDFFPEYCRVLCSGHNQARLGAGKSMPTLSEYLLLLGVSRISSTLNSKVHNVLTLKPAMDTVRAYFANTTHLAQLVDICLSIQEHNQSPMRSAPPSPISVIDIESHSFLVDLTLLLLNSDTNITAVLNKYNSTTIAESIMSSRLLPSLLGVYASLVQYYIQSSNTTAAIPDMSKVDAQLWLLSVKATFAVARCIMLDNKIPPYVCQYAPLMSAMASLSALLKTSTVSSLSTAWRPLLGSTVLCALSLKHSMALSRTAGVSSALSVDIPSLISMVIEGVNFTRQELEQSVSSVVAHVCQRDAKEEQLQEGEIEGVEALSLSTDPECRQGSVVMPAHIRTLAAIDASCQLLVRNDLPVLLTLLRRDAALDGFIRSYMSAWTQLIKVLNIGKNQVAGSTGDAQQALASSYERSIRLCKSLLTMLEGGSTSKSD
ncbi:hypothetical protein EON65_09395 [archaeon]|nr:MAG: hypothetical protein EON65_09395 [archaeon]